MTLRSRVLRLRDDDGIGIITVVMVVAVLTAFLITAPYSCAYGASAPRPRM